MKIKYYGVPCDAQLMRLFLLSKQITVSPARAQRLASLYKWFLEKPRQWENVRTVSAREKPADIYSGLKDSTYSDDVLLLADAGLIFPMTREATKQECASRCLAAQYGSHIVDFISDPANQKKLLAELKDVLSWFPVKNNSPR